MISPLGLVGLILIAVIGPDSPPLTTAATGLFIAALCYALARITDDIKDHHTTLALDAQLHREALTRDAQAHREELAKKLHGAVCEEALSWIGAHDLQVTRFETAASVLHNMYGPPSDGLTRLRAVRSHEYGRNDQRITPSA